MLPSWLRHMIQAFKLSQWVVMHRLALGWGAGQTLTPDASMRRQPEPPIRFSIRSRQRLNWSHYICRRESH